MGRFLIVMLFDHRSADVDIALICIICRSNMTWF